MSKMSELHAEVQQAERQRRIDPAPLLSAVERIADPEFWAVNFEGSDEEVNGRKAERGEAAYELACNALAASRGGA